MIGELRHVWSLLLGRVPHHLCCNVCARQVYEISRFDADILIAHKRLLCPCGGSLFSVHPALSKYRPGGVVR